MANRYEELREDIPILDVLLDLGASIPGWASGNGWGDWKKVVCPFCDDTNGSASYNAAAGRFFCHQCGAPRDGRSGDVVDVAKWQLGLDIHSTRNDDEAIEWLKSRFLRS